MRKFLAVFIWGGISISCFSQTRPNIIFILSDDISPKEYALYGGAIESPTLEKMAEEGVYFKTAWATPRCIPTRALLLTGKYPFRTRVFENQVYPRGDDGRIKPVGERYENTLGSLMSANGYRTAMIGKLQTGDVQSYGFQRWCTVTVEQIFDMRRSDMDVDGTKVVQENMHSTDFLFNYLKDFTVEESEDPWFVYMPLNLPHSVRNPDDPTKWGPPWVPVLDENWEPTGELIQNDFEACVRYIDYKIGGFIEHLDTIGQLDNTIIIYAGDNGTNKYGKSNPDSEKGPRVPFVVYAPGYFDPIGASDELVDFTDVIPTCVELAGGSLPEEDVFDGHSFAPLIFGQPFEGRDWIFSQWYGCRWLRTKRWMIDGRGMFYDCGDNRNEWVPGAYKDVTYSTDEQVIAVRKDLEKILVNLPAPNYSDPELAGQWLKNWINTNRFVEPYVPPYILIDSADKTNVIVILIDDMGYMDSETYGSKYYNTPNLTRLANEGMLFTNGYAASPLCSPTRASIMSGQYPARIRMTQAITNSDVEEPEATQAEKASWNSGNVQNRHHLPLDIYTLGEAMQDNGYHTAHIGKWHLYHSTLGEEYHAGNRGFDFVIGGNHAPGPPDYYSPYKNNIPNLSPGPEGEYLNERLAQESIDWISTVKDSEKPFFLNFWHYAVHGPVIPKLDLLQKYIDSRDPDAAQRCPEMATMLESMDTSIGILLDWLDKPENMELKANTVVILTSDNGGNTHSTTPNGDNWTSNRPIRGGKGNTYEGGVKVPWIVRWNDTVSAGSICHTAVQSTDIYPTVLDIAGIPPKPGHIIDGRSILPLFKGETMDDVPIFTDFPHRFGALCAPSATVRFGDWKLIRFYWAGERAESHYYELFNIADDPNEAINLREYFPDKVLELDSLIEQHLLDVDALIPIANSNYTGSSPFSRGNYVPNMTLPNQNIYFRESGQDTIQLMNENGEKQRSFGFVIEGESWVTVENKEDGKVIVSWDADKKDGSGKVLFGWTGGATAREINGWTMEPLILEFLVKEKEDLTLETLGSGSVSPSDGIHSYAIGKVVELTATPDGEVEFVSWVVNGEEISQNPIQVTMDKSLSAYALFSDGNLLRFATASARASNKDAYPSKANDGDTDAWTGWEDRVDAVGDPSWLEFSWNMPQLVNRVIVYANPNQSYNINDYTIQYWDGSVYQDIVHIENNTDAVRTSTFPSVSADKLRFYCTDEGDQAQFYRIDEIEVYYDTKEIEIKDVVGSGSLTPEVGIHTLARYDSLKLEAIPGEDWEFSKWVIDSTDTTDNPLTVYINATSSATAHFIELLDLSALQDALITARAMVDTATVGIGTGEYSQEAMDIAINAIQSAQRALDTASLQSVVDAALEALLSDFAKFVPNATGFDYLVFSGFTVYPNPVEDELYFCTNDPLSYRITNFNGSLLMKGELEGNNVDVGILENGMYLLQVIRKNKTTESLTFLKGKL